MHNHHISRQHAKRLGISILLNIAITLAELIGGLLSNSLALISDALHNFTDVVSQVLSFVAIKLSVLPSEAEKTFGYKRAEILAAFINALLLLFLSAHLLKNAFERLFAARPVNESTMIVIAIIAALCNGVSVIVLHPSAKKSLNIKSAYIHLFTDMLFSISVLVCGVLIYLTGFYRLDSIFTIFIAVFVLYHAVEIIIRAGAILMHFAPKHINVRQVKEEIEALPYVKNIHHMHIWSLTDNIVSFEGHIELVDDLTVSQTNEVKRAVSAVLGRHNITHYTLQFEYGSQDEMPLVKEPSEN